jgi:hypothetical protein
VEVFESLLQKIEIVFGHDPKCAHGGERAAVFAVELVDSLAINDQFPLITARQIEIAHQDVTRVVCIPVARVVHARPLVAGIARFARITP